MAAKNSEEPFFEFLLHGSKKISAYYAHADEAISRPFTLKVKLCSVTNISTSDLTGKFGVLKVLGNKHNKTKTSRLFHGIIVESAQTGHVKNHNNKKVYLYEVILKPVFYTLKMKSCFRIFQKKKVKEIIQEVMDSSEIENIHFKFSMMKSDYVKREYCVQYNESDFYFISRLMEEEGLFYFFEHSENKHTMIIGDSPSAYKKISGVYDLKFKNDLSKEHGEEYIISFLMKQRMTTGKTTLNDRNFEKPSENLKMTITGSDWQKYEKSGIDAYDSFTEEAHRKHRAEVKLEQETSMGCFFEADTQCHRITPGFAFKQVDHEIDKFNKEYVSVSVEHKMNQSIGIPSFDSNGGYNNQLTCIYKDIAFNSRPKFPKSRIHGIHTALVTGKENEEIYTDEYGRVKIKFYWDSSDTNNEKTSCWIRVNQISAGLNMGSQIIPRVGTEVIVDFIDGDPDKPFIIGQLYNGKNKPPYELPSNKTITTLKSKSSPDDDGYNELRFEDKKGKEEIYIHAQKDFNTLIENTQTTTIKNGDQSIILEKGKREISVTQGDVIQNIEKGNYSKTLNQGNMVLEIKNGSLTQTVKKDVNYTVSNGNYKHNVDKNYELKIGGNLKIEASGEIIIKGKKVSIN